MYKSVLDYFEETVAANKEKEALIHNNESCTFETLMVRGRKLWNEIIRNAATNSIFANRCIAAKIN